MKTVTEIRTEYLDGYGAGYTIGHQETIEGILKDIQESSVLSVEGIEIYLKELLK